MTDEAQQNIHRDLFRHMDGETEIDLTVTHDAKIRLGRGGLYLQSGLDVIYNNMLQAHRDQENIKCEWVEGVPGRFNSMLFETSCKNTNLLSFGDLSNNAYVYCPYCGKKIKERRLDDARHAPENF